MSACRRYRVGILVETVRTYGRRLYEGIARYARENRNWSIVVGGECEIGSIAALKGRLDGMIARVPGPRMATALLGLGIPVVDVYCGEERAGIARVLDDNPAIGRMAADWFVRRRFRSFAFCGYSGVLFSDLRCRAYQEALRTAGFACHVYVAPGHGVADAVNRRILGADDFGLPDDRDALAAWLKTLPPRTGVFCANDIRAYHVVRVCRELDIPVPDHLAVMGVDADPVICSLANPMLTSIKNDAAGVGYAGAALLARLMDGGRPDSAVPPLVAPCGLFEGASTETEPVDPPWLAALLHDMRFAAGQGLNATDMVGRAGFSYSKVEQAFRKALGHSVHQEIAMIRNDEVLRLLREAAMPVAEVGRRAGFSSPQYFCRQFKAMNGCTPQEWRERSFSPS